eukprot:TRINITY_DN9372_c0_g1_i3.p1 TRINITY_DN9372_c0_g1~~TRINITY_DN9372_c0_g1_i3.p1  ORF type:complete len:838 (+),score=160.36 TRINITY_DN9372_c0_g1_i3:36-2549(+)
MILNVHVEDLVFPVQCASGAQPLRWLGFIACQRYGLEKGHLHQQQFLPMGVLDEEGTILDPAKVINQVFQENSDVYIKIGGGTKAYSMRWPGRPETPRYALDEIEEIEMIPETVASKPTLDLAWIRKMEFRKFGIDKMLMNDMKRMTEQDVDNYARSLGMGAQSSNVGALKAIRDYAANRPDHISFKKGDKINVLENTDAVWWKGESNGKVGYFPAACLELEQVIAVRDFTGTKSDELNFQKGDIITLLDRSDANWWRGQIPPRSGKFPRTFVTLIPRMDNGDLDSGTKYIATRDSSPSNSEELAFNKGDIINILDFSRGDRWKGALNGAVGYFNPNLVCLLQDAGICTCKAKRDFPGNRQGELPFKKGDKIVVIEKVTTDLWRGMLNNRVGVFPASFVDLEQYVAVEAHDALQPDDLAFPQNAIVTLLDRSDSQRWKGEYDGKIGYFPPRSVTRAEQYPANRDYRAARGEELSLRKGDNVTVLQKSDGDYLLVSANGLVGYVPKSLVTLSDFTPTEPYTEALAVRDYAARSADEISFPKFATIQILDCTGDVWRGRYNGKVGNFPRALVEPLLGQKLVESSLSGGGKGKKQFSKDDVLDAEFSSMRAFFMENAGYFKNVFSYYSTFNTVGYSDINSMSSAQFMAFAKECRIITSQFRAADVDIIFVASNVQTSNESNSKSKKDTDKNMVIQEFIAGLIRIAHARYRHLPKLVDRVKSLYDIEIKPFAMPLLMELVKKFKIIHTPEMKLVYEKLRSTAQSYYNRTLSDDRVMSGRMSFDRFAALCKVIVLLNIIKLNSLFFPLLFFLFSILFCSSILFAKYFGLKQYSLGICLEVTS